MPEANSASSCSSANSASSSSSAFGARHEVKRSGATRGGTQSIDFGSRTETGREMVLDLVSGAHFIWSSGPKLTDKLPMIYEHKTIRGCLAEVVPLKPQEKVRAAMHEILKEAGEAANWAVALQGKDCSAELEEKMKSHGLYT